AYVAASPGLAIIDISDPATPEKLGSNVSISGPYFNGIVVAGVYVYVATPSGLAMINISDPANPGAPTFLGIAGGARDVAVAGNYAYVAAGGSGLAIVKL
ncbi:MAG: hypothetical protein E4H09_03780, partial [Spirochaetales bacterium]